MVSRERIEEILRETGALLEGHFLLTSGRHSGQYMQCAKILQHPQHVETLAGVFVETFGSEKIDIVVGPATGGIILAYEAARLLHAQNMFTERENGKMTLRRGFAIEKGARVLITEDVITTGGSVKEVIDLVKAQGGDVVGVGVLVDRSNGSIDFGVKLCAAYSTEVVSYEADNCPLCQKGGLPAVKPGSRSL